MFMARLDNAREEKASEAKEITKTPKRDSKDQKASSSSKFGDKSEIINDLSEYLFDLFDANCTEDYKKMERFEKRALVEFQSLDSKEFSHAQFKLHQEFTEIFESLLEGFLVANDCSMESLYEQLEHFSKKTPGNKPNKYLTDDWDADPKSKLDSVECAQEVVEVITCYLNFEFWVEMMFNEARQQRQFQSLRYQILSAIDNDRVNSQSTKHRLDG